MNTKESLKILQVLVTELSNNAFEHKLQSRIFKSQGFEKLAAQYESHSNEESGWVEKFTDRILDLGGELKLEDRRGVKLCEDPVEYVKSELDTQEKGLALVAKFLEKVREDYTTYDIIKDYYKDEEDDLYWMQTTLDLVKKLGDKNWLLTQL